MNDLASLGVITTELDRCGDISQEIRVAVQNLGANTQSNVQITLNITGPNPATLTGTLTGTSGDRWN